MLTHTATSQRKHILILKEGLYLRIGLTAWIVAADGAESHLNYLWDQGKNPKMGKGTFISNGLCNNSTL